MEADSIGKSPIRVMGGCIQHLFPLWLPRYRDMSLSARYFTRTTITGSYQRKRLGRLSCCQSIDGFGKRFDAYHVRG